MILSIIRTVGVSRIYEKASMNAKMGPSMVDSKSTALLVCVIYICIVKAKAVPRYAFKGHLASFDIFASKQYPKLRKYFDYALLCLSID